MYRKYKKYKKYIQYNLKDNYIKKKEKNFF